MYRILAGLHEPFLVARRRNPHRGLGISNVDKPQQRLDPGFAADDLKMTIEESDVNTSPDEI